MAPAREAEIAGGMTKVPKAWGLTAPVCSHYFFRGPMMRGMTLAFVLISARSNSSFWNIHFFGGPWQARDGETGNHFTPRLRNILAVARSSAVRGGGRSNRGLWIFMLAGFRGPDPHRVTPYSLAWCVAFKMGCRRSHIFLANVPRQVSLAGGEQ